MGQPVLVVNPTSLTAGVQGGTTGFTVSNSGVGTINWTAKSNASWITVSPVSGTNSGTVTVTYLAGTSNARTGTITVSATGLGSQNITVSQGSDFVRGVFLFGNSSVDYKIMHDSLNLNWVQVEGEDAHGNLYSNAINNSYLNVMGQMNKVIVPNSGAQEMAFKATQAPSSIFNYFSTHNGTPQGNLLKDSVGENNPGYMVEGCTPNNQYNFDITNYIASFILMRGSVSPPPNNYIVRLEAWVLMQIIMVPF